jgi:peptide/nickel transport system permease protein
MQNMENQIHENTLTEAEKKSLAVGPWRLAWDRFRKNRVALVGGIMFAVIVVSIFIVPLLSPYTINEFDLAFKNQPPSARHWLGTDEQGRDVMLRIFLGGRISMRVGLMAAGVTVILGAMVGGIAGYYGGLVDNLLMRFAEIVYSIPFTPTVISISAALMFKVSSEYKMYLVMLLIGILSWPSLARIVRGQILSLREQEFMQATEALGLSAYSRIVRHLLPNTLAYIIVTATLSMAAAILTEAGLSFLGLGVTPPTPTWGNMIERARDFKVFRDFYWMWIPPGVMIMLTVVSINLLGEGLRDSFDPKENR